MFYATADADNDRIAENATIVAFETLEAAREWLLGQYDAACWDRASAAIEPGRFGDAWIKVHSAPVDDADYFAPFRRDQLYIAAPGSHPGGRAWWIEPTPEVLVVTHIVEREI